ncbi:MAG: alpha/beta hydrolase fold domain-containing protein [Bryobacteraceae bacterium]
MRFWAAAILFSSSALWAQTPPSAPPMPDTVSYEADIEYSNVGGRVAMDIVRPKADSAAPRPAVLLIHGGGFRAGNRQSYLPVAIRLAERGYVAATMSYRLAPRNQYPAAVHDAKAAVRFLRANAARFGLDPEHIGTMGGSAGGHIVLMLGLTGDVAELEGTGPNPTYSSRVQCVVNYYGPSDFTQSYSKSVDAKDVLPLFLGGDLDHNRLIHQQASPINWVTPNAAPTLSIHGTNDTFVAYEHSLWITEKLVAAGVPAELETISGAGHGFKGADADRAEARAFAYFDRYLKAKPPQRQILISDHGPVGEIVAMDWPSGKVHWTVPNEHGHDVQSLPNGHVLYTLNPKKIIVEMDANHKPVWSYGPDEGLEHPLAAQRLANGNTLIGDAKLGRVIEVTPDKKVVWKYESPDLANMRMRNAHRTDAGTTLIAIEAIAKIIEVDKGGKIIWSWQAPNGEKRRSYMARRLANGNTMISISDPGEVVEVNPAGEVVRSIAGNKLDIQFGWASGFVPLADGGILIADYTGRRIVEVDAKGKVVNELRTGPRTIASIDLVQ